MVQKKSLKLHKETQSRDIKDRLKWKLKSNDTTRLMRIDKVKINLEHGEKLKR